MIHFSEIANPPTPVYIPMCVACDGRGVVPSLSRNSVQRCEQCNGTGKEGNTPEPADIPQPPSYKDLRAAAYPSIADQLDAIWKGGEAEAVMLKQVMAVKSEYPKA